MYFFSAYGLFLLKALTIVIAILVLFAGIFSIGRKSKPKLEITLLNKQYDDLKQQLAHVVTNKKSKQKKLKNQVRPSIYVLDFYGDIKASQVEELREAITAVLLIAGNKDEVVLRLESPGGSVNGYGLAASQLARVRDKEISLTICIDKIAASGGYLMACVANTIIAAPFAIIGSIGVVAQLPNFHRFLKKNNIDIELLTAGEYKRTLTMFAENTETGRKKFQEDLEKIHAAFKGYLLAHRKQVDIDKISTGEHWLAKDALDLQLVDLLKTSDEYLLEKMAAFNVFKISIPGKKSLIEKILKPAMYLLHPWA